MCFVSWVISPANRLTISTWTGSIFMRSNPVAQQSGPDIPGEHVYSNTPLNTSYYTFDVSRYLTTTDYKSICDYAANVPYDQIFVLINSNDMGVEVFTIYIRGVLPIMNCHPKSAFMNSDMDLADSLTSTTNPKWRHLISIICCRAMGTKYYHQCGI